MTDGEYDAIAAINRGACETSAKAECAKPNPPRTPLRKLEHEAQYVIDTYRRISREASALIREYQARNAKILEATGHDK